MISLEDKEGLAITELIFPKMDVCRITNQRYMEGTFLKINMHSIDSKTFQSSVKI